MEKGRGKRVGMQSVVWKRQPTILFFGVDLIMNFRWGGGADLRPSGSGWPA